MKLRSVSLVVVSLVSSLAQAVPPKPPYANVGTPRVTRACSSDTFTLEAPLAAPGFPLGFEAAFATNFSTKGAVFACSACTTFRAVLRPVFPDYSNTAAFPAVPASRRDGHRRAFVISFQGLKPGSTTWTPTTPLATAECQVLKAIRTAAAKALVIAEPTSCCAAPLRFHVARGCEAIVQDAEAFNTPAVTNWALARIKVPPPAVLPAVEVALVDTGVPSNLRTMLGVASEQPLPAFEGTASSTYHPHGTHMAALIRSAAPHATIRSYRALDERGMGSLSSVARSVDDVLFGNNRALVGRPPLVVNLSVGAPPEVDRPAAFSGASCTSWEDGAGESLRYALRVAAEVDSLSSTVFIASAAGNSVLEKTSVAETSWVLGTARTPCGASAGTTGPSAFLPAAFGESPSCLTSTGAAAVLPVIPVGATTYDDRRSAVTQSASEPYLFAPGERVFAAHPAMPPVEANVACGPADVGLAKGFESPATVSGTSASTALVSAAAAQVLARAAAPSAGGGSTFPPPRAGWRGAWLARLLYLTGQPVCMKGIPSLRRRIMVERAIEAATSSASACLALKACTADPTHTGAALNASTAWRCATPVAGCFAAAPLPTCGVSDPEPGWADEFTNSVSPTSPCAHAWDAGPGPATFRPSGPNARFTGSQLAGLGPQPANPACPNCSVRIESSGTMTLYFEINDAFPRETTFTDAFVAVMDDEKNVFRWIPVSDGEVWRPGMVGKLQLVPEDPEMLSTAVRLLRSGGTLALDVAVTTPEGRPEEGRNESVLRLVFR